MIAGLPKAPSLYNPIVNPDRALLRRNYVLRRMRELNKITGAQYSEAIEQPVTATLHRTATELDAGYVSEMARAQMVEWLGSRAYTGGYKVYTTIDSRLQQAATAALRTALQNYEQRHGLRLPGKATREDTQSQDSIDEILATLPAYGDLQSAIVVKTTPTSAIAGNRIQWASPRSDEDKEKPKFSQPAEILKPLDLIYVQTAVADTDAEKQAAADAQVTTSFPQFALAQMPDVEGALVSLNPSNGKIVSLVGGFDFYRSKFNRVTQAYRQPGSNFKPFVYSAALEHGDTAATIYNDTPVVLEDNVLEDEWRPRNYSGRFFGPTRLREALVKSRNLVSIRLLQKLGIPRAVRYASRFQFEPRSLPRNLSLVLGSGDMTPLQLATGYAVFANGGYYIAPRYIERIVDGEGVTIYQAPDVQFCDTEAECAELTAALEQGFSNTTVAVAAAATASSDNGVTEEAEETTPGIPLPPAGIVAERIIDERNAFIMRSFMREVITRGTARRAKVLARADIAGKTGTTNDLYDAWFTGFNSRQVATAWIGYDEQRSLGPKESGGVAALPMWIDYMRTALDGVPVDKDYQPEGVATVRVSRKTGKLTLPGDENAFFEFFREENIPAEEPQQIAVKPRVVPPSNGEVFISEGSGAAAPVVSSQPADVGDGEQLF